VKATLFYPSSIAAAACLVFFHCSRSHSINTREAQSRERTVETRTNENNESAPESTPPDEMPAWNLERRTTQAFISGDADDFLKLLADLAHADPAAAARLAQSAGSLREAAMRVVAQNWAALDRAGAERWATQLPNPEERDTALNYLCYQVNQSDPVQAIRIARHHGIAGQKGLIQNLTEQWAGKDFPSASAWASRQSASEERDQIYMRLALVLSKTAPRDAAELLIDEIPPGAVQTEAAISVVHQWAIGDYAGAAAWVVQFPSGDLRERAAQELAGFSATTTSQSP